MEQTIFSSLVLLFEMVDQICKSDSIKHTDSIVLKLGVKERLSVNNLWKLLTCGLFSRQRCQMALEEMGYVYGDAFIILYFWIYIWTICSHYKLLLYGKEEQEISNFVEFFWGTHFHAQRLLLLIKSSGPPWSSNGCDRITNTNH